MFNLLGIDLLIFVSTVLLLLCSHSQPSSQLCLIWKHSKTPSNKRIKYNRTVWPLRDVTFMVYFMCQLHHKWQYTTYSANLRCHKMAKQPQRCSTHNAKHLCGLLVWHLKLNVARLSTLGEGQPWHSWLSAWRPGHHKVSNQYCLGVCRSQTVEMTGSPVTASSKNLLAALLVCLTLHNSTYARQKESIISPCIVSSNPERCTALNLLLQVEFMISGSTCSEK